MLLSPRKHGLHSLFQEVRVFKDRIPLYPKLLAWPPLQIVALQNEFLLCTILGGETFLEECL